MIMYPTARLTTGEAQLLVYVLRAAIEDESIERERRLMESALAKIGLQLSGHEQASAVDVEPAHGPGRRKNMNAADDEATEAFLGEADEMARQVKALSEKYGRNPHNVLDTVKAFVTLPRQHAFFKVSAVDVEP